MEILVIVGNTILLVLQELGEVFQYISPSSTLFSINSQRFRVSLNIIMSSSKSRVFRLRCLNDEIIEVNEAAAVLCETIKNMVEEGCDGDEISVPNVTAEILGKVMEWCKRHAKGGTQRVGR